MQQEAAILTMEAPGATAEQVLRGIAAAEAVFSRYGTTPLQAADASMSREHQADDYEIGPDGIPEMTWSLTDEELRIANAWNEACQVAVEVCYQGVEKPDTTQLMLRERSTVH